MDDPSGCLIRIIVLIVVFIVTGVFYGFGAALQVISRTDFEGNDSPAEYKAIKCFENPHRFVNTVQMIGIINTVFLALYEVPFFASLCTQKHAGSLDSSMLYLLFTALFAFILIILTLVFTVFAPKKIGAAHSSRFIKRYIGFVWAVITVLSPIAFIITKLSHIPVRICGIDPLSTGNDVTEEEIISMVDEGNEQGVLKDSEAEMIHNIFDLNDKDAKDIMTHRKNIVSIDGDMTLENVLQFVLEQNFSRFPVFDENIDTLIGILHIKDTMQLYRQERLRNKKIRDIKQLLRPITYIPETRSIDVLFRDMQREKNHIVVVIDEYGQTSGIVAMEDILEEIVGNILDEYDVEEDPITRQPDGSYIILGMTPLEDIEDELSIDFQDEDNETLNGFLISRLDRIPCEKEHIEIPCCGYIFRVLTLDNKTIGRVLVMKSDENNIKEEI